MKVLDIILKNWVPLRKLSAPPGVPSWLRACTTGPVHNSIHLYLQWCTSRKISAACNWI